MSEKPRYPFVHIRASRDEEELLSYELFELGALGVETRDQSTLLKNELGDLTLIASFGDIETAEGAIAVLGEHRASLSFVEGDDFLDEWRRFFKPARIGERVVIRPSWEPFDASPDDLVLVIDPGRAFGTGLHESTRLVIRCLESIELAGVELLDLGTGSGVLAIAALLLGADRAIGTDIDSEAVEVSLENAAINGVADRFEALVQEKPEFARRYPLVLANIESRVLVPLAREIAATVADGGRLILSGLLADEAERIEEAYPDFTRIALHQEREWIAIMLERRAAASDPDAKTDVPSSNRERAPLPRADEDSA